MTNFLWVEDFNASEDKRPDNIISSTVKSVFGSVLDEKEFREKLKEEDANDAQDFLEEKGILLKLNLLEALEFIRSPDELAKIDFVVLDVDMPLRRDGQKDDNNYLPELLEQYPSENELSRIAGYQIYTELVIELGFPKSHILFCSNHAKYFDELKGKFASANIKPPLSSNPDKPFLTKDDKTDIEQWLDDAQCDYFVLRRGIIKGCQSLVELIEEKKLTKNDLIFNRYIKEPENEVNLEDMRDYLGVLENFLPLREPSSKAVLYKLFIRTLTHEWEAADSKKIRSLEWIMKNTRNWIVHNSALFSELDEAMVAYLFIVNMRVMFNFDESIQLYEEILQKLFYPKKEEIEKQKLKPLDTEEFKKKNGIPQYDENGKMIYLKGRKIPLDEAYLKLKNIVLDERKDKKEVHDGFYFNELANNIQESKSEFRKDKKLFMELLYQMFWLTTSNPFISTGNRKNLLEIKFWNFNYAEKPYLLELARHIYNRSFL